MILVLRIIPAQHSVHWKFWNSHQVTKFFLLWMGPACTTKNFKWKCIRSIKIEISLVADYEHSIRYLIQPDLVLKRQILDPKWQNYLCLKVETKYRNMYFRSLISNVSSDVVYLRFCSRNPNFSFEMGKMRARPSKIDQPFEIGVLWVTEFEWKNPWEL